MFLLLISTGEEEEDQLVLKLKHSIITCPIPHLNKIPDKLLKMWLHKPHRSCKGGEDLGASGSAGAGLAEPQPCLSSSKYSLHQMFPMGMKREKCTLTQESHITPRLGEQTRKKIKVSHFTRQTPTHVLSLWFAGQRESQGTPAPRSMEQDPWARRGCSRKASPAAGQQFPGLG